MNCRPFAVLVLCAMPAFAQQFTDPAKVGVDVTVNAIQNLENQRDPKCDATATRLENFMYGTPLSVGAREKKVELQKRLILSVWKQASEAARAAGKSEISADMLTPIIQRNFAYTMDDAKNAHVKLGDGSELVLEERDVRQYGTVAYALRAILAVQQDALLTPDVKLVPFTPDAVQAMKQMVDVYTLAALNLGDKAARKAGLTTMTAANIENAWTRIAPAVAEKKPALKEVSSAKAEPQPGEVLRKILAQKMVSVATYNSNADPLLYSNIQSFYARYPWPSDTAKVKEIIAAFTAADMDFVAQTLAAAQQKAKAEGSPVVREKHIREVYNETAPYDVNIYEDVIFFSHLPKAKQIYIEAYDADSLRDSGVHWQLIKNVIDSPSFPLQLDVDPFAAELLAEGDAQMGVLLFRVAGQIAKEQNAPTLTPEHIAAAQKLIAQRFADQLRTPAPKPPVTKLASSSAKTRPATGKFFDDVTDRTGIDYMHRSSDWLSRFQRTFLYSIKGTDAVKPGGSQPAEDFPPTFSGSGIAAEDINNDGWPDVLIVGGLGNKLYINNGDGTFRDETAKAGINWIGPDGKPGEPRQPLIVDLDNDGLKDIVISYVNAPHRVYRNNGDGTFSDVTATANLGGDGLVGGPIVAFDFDRDGLLDLYVGYYGNYLQGVGPNLARVNRNGTPNKLFRNAGGFKFVEVPNSGTENTGWTQAAVSVDFDNDGWPDLVVGNDFGINSYYRNKHDGTFEDVAPQMGTDLPASSMNVGTADLNKDGYPEFYISNIVAMVKDEKYVMPTEETKMKRKPEKLATMRVVQNNQLFVSTPPSTPGGLPHYAITDAVIDPMDTSTGWAWDADFFDFDNDGDDDLYVVNGLHEYYIYSSQFKVQTSQGEKEMQFAVHEKEPNVFYVNENGRLQNRSTESGADFSGNSRSAAYLDFDNDGDLDIVINNFDSKAVFLVNNSEKLHNNWIKVKLIGNPAKHSNRDAIGATIVATTPSGNRVWREVQSATGYLSQHPSQQLIGLGKEVTADIVVTWPNGERREYKNLAANKVHTITQE
jgi:enediyne biosynthesis protein E4